MKRIAVIGLGNIAYRHLKNIKSLFPDARIMVISASGRTLDAADLGVDTSGTSIEDVIAFNPDMAVVASPATYHADHVVALVSRGIPVMVEKPIAGNFAQAQSILSTLAQSKSSVAVGYILRYLGSAKAMKKAIEDEVVGRIYHVSVNVGQFLPDWRPGKSYQNSVSASAKLGGGVLLELSHELDYLRWLFGPLTLQFAHLCHSHELNLEVEEMADVLLTFGEGSVCSLHMDFLQKTVQRYCHVIGELGRLEWDIVTNSVLLTTPDGNEELYSDPGCDRNQMYLDLMREFVAAIEGKHKVAMHVQDACDTVQLIDEIKQKANWGAVL